MVQVLSTCRDYDGRTPLHLAASEGREAVVRCLLQPGHGMHLGAKDRNDNTPLANAAKHRHLGVVSLLVEAGAPLGLAEHRLSGILCSLTQARDHDGLRLYIAAKADVTAADYDHRTALHIAAADGNPEATRLLLGAGADPSSRDRWGRTALQEATTPNNPEGGVRPHRGHGEVAAMLRGHGGRSGRPTDFVAVD